MGRSCKSFRMDKAKLRFIEFDLPEFYYWKGEVIAKV